jgi:hypothetical protein
MLFELIDAPLCAARPMRAAVNGSKGRRSEEQTTEAEIRRRTVRAVHSRQQERLGTDRDDE